MHCEEVRRVGVRGTRRRVLPVLACVLGALVGGALTASAAGLSGLATLNLAAARGMAGSEITVSGSNFAPSGVATSAGTVAGPVAIHWDTAAGAVLAEAPADTTGAVADLTLTIPAAARPGVHILVAAQADQHGAAIPGTPALASFTVTAGRVGEAQQPIASPPSSDQIPPSVATGLDAGFDVMLGVAAVSGLLLCGIGLAAASNALRRRPMGSRRGRR